VLSNLGKLVDPTHLTAVFVSHGHMDHYADIFALQAALRYAPSGPMAPLPLYVPDGLFPHMQEALGGRSAEELAGAFEVHTLQPDQEIRLGSIRVTPRPVEHVVPAFALVATDGGGVLCYTSDSRPGDTVRVAAAGAQVVMADSTMPQQYEDRAPHMTPRQAAAVARDVGAHTVILTHMWPTLDRDEARAQAEAVFDGRVIIANELDSLDID
jgi:ribonuclease BN (tRNA processing enzyme)